MNLAGSTQPLHVEDPGRVILDWSTPFDLTKVQLLEKVSKAMYAGRSAQDVSAPPPRPSWPRSDQRVSLQIQYANKVLNDFKSNENAWRTVDKILDNCQDINVRFFALQILDDAIKVSARRSAPPPPAPR